MKSSIPLVLQIFVRQIEIVGFTNYCWSQYCKKHTFIIKDITLIHKFHWHVTTINKKRMICNILMATKNFDEQ